MTLPLIHIPEPTLLFRYGQALEDPRDGLMLFGPVDHGKIHGIRAGVVGTASGIAKYKAWVARIQTPVRTPVPRQSRPPFAGFESTFRIPWPAAPAVELLIDEGELQRCLHQDDRHQRVYATVDLFVSAILRADTEEEAKPDFWFVVIPDEVRKYCRPQSGVETALRTQAPRSFAAGLVQNRDAARGFLSQPSLFEEMNQQAQPYAYKEHFRNQLKARLLPSHIATQVVRESTLANIGARADTGRGKSEELLQSQIAWNLSTTAYYKCGARPWKVSGVRPGVAYLGLVFKRCNPSLSDGSVACGAQMFLDSGDGLVFKGAIGKWRDAEREEYHLSEAAARELLSLALAAYKDKHAGAPPRELFIHGQTRFNQNEWAGFSSAVDPKKTSLVGVRIRDDSNLKLFRNSDNPVLRGTAYVSSNTEAYLWTKGWTPRLKTYPGLEVPNPLSIQVSHGAASMETVLADVLGLTKLNYNTCRYGDGKPITLKFADAVGEVLTAGTPGGSAPLPFMYYI